MAERSRGRELTRELLIGSAHPALSGHFPGNPVVPGALLLDEVLHAIEALHGPSGTAAAPQGWQIEVVKFLHTVRPEQRLRLKLHTEPRGEQARYAFEIEAADRIVVRGHVVAVGAGAHSALGATVAAPGKPVESGESAEPGERGTQGWRDRPERGNALLLRWMAAVSLRLGRPVARVLLWPIAAYYFCFAPRASAAMNSYLRRALDRRPTARDRMRLILSFANTIHDRLWLLRERGELFDITLEGESVVREAVGSGGAFLLGAHMGSFEVLRLVGRRQGFTVAISMYEAQARRLNALLDALAPSETLEIIPVGHLDSMLRMRAALEQGHLVGVLADRQFGPEPTLAVRFLGATAYFPVNPMRLAAILRRRAVFMLGLYRGANRYHVVFEPLADFTDVTPAQRPAAIEAAVQRYAQLLERRCRSDPYNWFNFFEFWPATQRAAEGAGTPAAGPAR